MVKWVNPEHCQTMIPSPNQKPKTNLSAVHTSYVLSPYKALASFFCARERLKRMRSALNIQMVQMGRVKLKGGKHLQASAQYPIGLGMKAGVGVCSAMKMPPESKNNLIWMSVSKQVGSLLKEYLRLGILSTRTATLPCCFCPAHPHCPLGSQGTTIQPTSSQSRA